MTLILSMILGSAMARKFKIVRLLFCLTRVLNNNSLKIYKAFFNHYIETCNFDPLTLSQFSNVFFASYSLFFPSQKCGCQYPTHPLHTFPVIGLPLFGLWSESARKVPKSRKIGVGWVASTLKVIF